MKTITLGRSPLISSRIAYGAWRLAGTWDPSQVTPEREARSREAVLAAVEAGFTLFDHADIYCDGLAETLFGRVLSEIPDLRPRILIASKCGIRKPGDSTPSSPYRYDFSASHILESCEKSLQRLGTDHLDLYQLHRPDVLCDPAEVADAFARLKESGKALHFGVSNFRPSQVAMLQQACPMPLLVNQVEIHLDHLAPFNDGTLDQCLERGMTPLAWSPLGGGRLANQSVGDLRDPDHARKLKLHEVLGAVGRDRGLNHAQVALAWLLRHPAGIVPIIGTLTPTRIQEAAATADVELTREEWYHIYEAALGHRMA
ncbi:MAG TPA: aldo/keto reductase [Verrucomicrobiota bacterium]|nr:aldo/keto reductase [Verrucomicrobiota bacterium]HNU50880.1 aldo/keto reductase [Verrucomicrobiota bacterium]